MRKKIYSKYLSNNSEIKFKQILILSQAGLPAVYLCKYSKETRLFLFVFAKICEEASKSKRTAISSAVLL